MSNLKYYDSINYDDEILDFLEDDKADFEEWLEAVLTVEFNKNQRNEGELNFNAIYVSPESGKKQSADIKIHVTDGSHSYFCSRSGDVDVDWLNVSCIYIQHYPLKRDVVIDYIREQNRKGVSPNKDEIAVATGFRTHVVHNVLCEICYREQLVQEFPRDNGPGYCLTSGKRKDGRLSCDLLEGFFGRN